jgi:2-aminoadipate transaminase
VMSEYLREGLYDSHIDQVRAIYRAKRDVAEASLHTHGDPWVRWRTPEGGFFLWVELDGSIDAERALDRARQAGAIVRMGSGFFGDPEGGKQRFRLAFSELPIEEIDRGITVLGQAIAGSIRESSKP